MRHFIFTLLLSLWVFPFANAATAQGVLSLLPTAQETAVSDAEGDAARLQEVIRQAAESGVSVVVVDSAGQLLNQPASAQPAEGDQQEAALAKETSALMHLQERGNQFRTALIERIVQLPDAINEVIYILRAASPDGTLWAFGETLLVALALFAVGAVVEVELFGKRMARGFVTAKVQANPVGYTEKMPFLVFRFFMGIIGVLVSMVVPIFWARCCLDRLKTRRSSSLSR